MTKQVPLTKGQFALVDDEDFDFINQWKWKLSDSGYAIRYAHIGMENGKRKSKRICMHRLLADTPDHLQTDHINTNKLDNRRSNLRNCTKSQNHMNKRKRLGLTSAYKGVHKDKRGKGKYEARICVGGVSKRIGRFVSEIDAAKAYNAAAIETYGEYARINEV